jgi:hypothetical protein
MIDIDKIEAAASADKELDTVTVLRPAIVREMVSMIRERDAVMHQALKALAVISSGVCEAAHHAKKDQHDMGVLCPIEKRHYEAIAAIRKVLEL